MKFNPKTWAAIGTAVVSLLVLWLLVSCRLSLTKPELVQDDKGEIVLDEEFIDVLELPSLPDMAGEEESRATADEQLESQPTPVSGTDVKDAGPSGEPPRPVVSKTESPVKVQEKEQKQQAGPAVDAKKKEEEEIKRKADNEVANAFNKSQGKHNNAAGAADVGNNGKPDGNAPQGSLTGHGTGTAGGGWGIPAYGAVQSPVTGSVKMVVTIDKAGNVTALRFDGGDAPAATNTAVRNACAAEVRSRKFTRSNYDNAPETSTAYITYTFR